MKKIRQQFADTIYKIGNKDKNIVVMVVDISHGIMQPFAKKNKKRYFNIGICEPAMMNVAAGVSKLGLIPIVHTIAPFLIERSFEQIKLDFCYQKLPVNIVSVGSTFDYSKLGCSHHCYSDFALISQLDNSNFFYPGSPVEFDILFKQTYKKRNINYFRISDFNHNIPLKKKLIKYGKGVKIKSGKDITIIFIGNLLNSYPKILNTLVSKKINPEILYLNTLKPLDENLIINSLKKTRKLFIVENFMQSGGFASYCLTKLNNKVNFKFNSASIENFNHNYGTYENLQNVSGISTSQILNKIMKFI